MGNCLPNFKSQSSSILHDRVCVRWLVSRYKISILSRDTSHKSKNRSDPVSESQIERDRVNFHLNIWIQNMQRHAGLLLMRPSRNRLSTDTPWRSSSIFTLRRYMLPAMIWTMSQSHVMFKAYLSIAIPLYMQHDMAYCHVLAYASYSHHWKILTASPGPLITIMSPANNQGNNYC
jgi:hypothetical protein